MGVAIGTSLPDTFASKTAAVQDPTADNSIGNVTGSNSVNVFLGLGLPWGVGAIYWKLQEDTGPWVEHGRANWPVDVFDEVNANWQHTFVVPAGSLGASVMTFSTFATCALGILMVRGFFLGAELGGPKLKKLATSIFFVLMWFAYIIISIFV